MEKGFKVSLNASLLRVRLTMTLDHIAQHQQFPESFIMQAKEKISALKDVKYVQASVKQGKVFWKNVKFICLQGGYESTTLVHFDLAQGCPDFPGYSMNIDKNNQPELVLSEKAQSLKGIPFVWFKVWVEETLAQQGYKDKIHRGILYSIWLHLQQNKITRSFKFTPAPAKNEKPYNVIVNRARGECYFQINDFFLLDSENFVEKILRISLNAVKKIEEATKCKYDFHKNLLVQALREFVDSGERYTSGESLVLLFANQIKPIVSQMKGSSKVNPSPQKMSSHSKDKVVAQARKNDRDEGALGKNDDASNDYLGRGFLKIEVSDDKLEALVGPWDMTNYDVPNIKLDELWLDKEIKRNRIVFGIDNKSKAEVVNKLRRKESIEGCFLAKGQVGVPASGPYLHPIYKDVKPVVGESEIINIRDFQERTIVESGELVAVLQYENAAEAGHDVYGKPLEGNVEDFEIELGEGIVEKRRGEYYAEYTGMPIINGSSISVSKMLFHNGDVNLRSGNIRFDGPVEIKGSIDVGCVVECSGVLIVHGAIRGGQIIVGGDMTVANGIITTKEGSIRCRGNLACEFIENSKVICHGNITVKKSIVNSHVFCGGYVLTDTKQGRIAGGRLCVDHLIECASLGSDQGVRTELDVGRDWRNDFAVEIRTNRHQKLKDLLEESKKELNTLKSRTKAQMTKKHEELKEELQIKVNRLTEIVTRAKNRLASGKESICYNSNARIVVHGLLAQGCVIRIAEAKVKLQQTVMAVQVTNRKKKGSYIHPLEDQDLEIIDREKKQLADPAARSLYRSKNKTSAQVDDSDENTQSEDSLSESA